MTAATTSAPSPTTAATAARPLAGTATLVRFQLRRDRIRLPAWAAGFALFTMYLVAALPAAYETEGDLAAATQLFRDPVGRMLIGPGYGFDNPTFARFIANGYGLYFLLLAAIMSLLLVARHTRMEEQTGRAELVRASVVGRHAPLTATLIMAVVTNLAAGAAVVVVMLAAGGFGAVGSVLLAAGMAAIGLVFAGVTAITAQLTEYSRAAAGMTGAVLGAAFVVRAGGDMAEGGGSALSWLSPLAWGQQTAPFVLDRWWPLALAVAAAGAAWAVGYGLSARRDLGASLFAVTSGRTRAAPSLGTTWGLAVRLQRASIIGWGAALAVAGLVFGAYTDPLLDALGDLPDVFAELFGGADDMVTGYMAYMAVFMAYLASAYAIMAVQGLRNEETNGRADPVLATPVSRWGWLGTNLAVTAVAVVAIMLITGVATGLGAAIVTGDGSYVADLTVAHLNHIPGVWVVLGLAALLYGAVPRALAVAWLVVGYGLVIGTFGSLLELPAVAFDLSPYEHAAEMPLEPFAAAPVIGLTLLAAGLAAVGLVAFRRRAINAA